MWRCYSSCTAPASCCVDERSGAIRHRRHRPPVISFPCRLVHHLEHPRAANSGSLPSPAARSAVSRSRTAGTPFNHTDRRRSRTAARRRPRRAGSPGSLGDRAPARRFSPLAPCCPGRAQAATAHRRVPSDDGCRSNRRRARCPRLTAAPAPASVVDPAAGDPLVSTADNERRATRRIARTRLQAGDRSKQ